MAQYIFRPPAAARELSWKLEDLLVWLGRGGETTSLLGHRRRKLGATVEVQSFSVPPRHQENYVRVTLYETDIARIYEDRVIVGNVDIHHSNATAWWISRILASNRDDFVDIESVNFKYMMTTSVSPTGYAETPIHNATIERITYAGI